MIWLDAARYYLALMLVATWPAAFGFWFVIHPLAGFWRRAGYVWAYVTATMVMILLTAGALAMRSWLMAVDFGPSAATAAVGLPFLTVAGAVQRARRQYLTFPILAGMPEIAPARYPGTLFTEGIYARVRHPRYLEVVLGFTGWAFVTNYLAAYALVPLTVVFVRLLIAVEERELVERFGAAYDAYRRRVPMIVPRLGPRAE